MTLSEAYILFEVAGASYAVAASQVQQVEMLESLTRVPRAPEFVEGVTPVRGRPVPVVSLRARFHLEPLPPDLRTRLVIIRLGARRIALRVDSAREFVRIPAEAIQPPPPGLDGPGVEYLEGVATLKDRLVMIINLHRLFGEDEKKELHTAPSLEE